MVCSFESCTTFCLSFYFSADTNRKPIDKFKRKGTGKKRKEKEGVVEGREERSQLMREPKIIFRSVQSPQKLHFVPLLPGEKHCLPFACEMDILSYEKEGYKLETCTYSPASGVL